MYRICSQLHLYNTSRVYPTVPLVVVLVWKELSLDLVDLCLGLYHPANKCLGVQEDQSLHWPGNCWHLTEYLFYKIEIVSKYINLPIIMYFDITRNDAVRFLKLNLDLYEIQDQTFEQKKVILNFSVSLNDKLLL